MRSTLLLLFALVSLAPRSRAQNVSDLADRLRAADTRSAIDGSDVKPWHLKLDVQLYDAKGQPSDQGFIEQWWLSKDIYRISYSFPSYKGTVLHNQDGAFRTKGLDGEPGVLRDTLRQIVHPVDVRDMANAKLDLRKEKFGTLQEDCIMLDQPLKTVAFPPLGLFPTYCLEPGKDDLRVSTDAGSITFVRNRIGIFQTKLVAVDLTGDTQGVKSLSAHVSALSEAKLTDSDFNPGSDLEKFGAEPVLIDSHVIGATILRKVRPIYPESSKTNRVSGSVLLRVIIGTDGHVYSVHVVSAPDAALALASINAVRQWVYKPYVANGLPTEVDTTITVNFSFGPG